MRWFIIFAVAPIAFLTGYSLVKFEQAIDLELQHRLFGVKREIQVLLSDFERGLKESVSEFSTDPAVTVNLVSRNIDSLAFKGSMALKKSLAHQLSIFDGAGRLQVTLARDNTGQVTRLRHLENKEIFLSERFVSSSANINERIIADFSGRGVVDLVSFSKIRSSKGVVVGFVEAVIHVNVSFLENLRARLGIEMVLASEDGDAVVASQDNLMHYRQGYFVEKFKESEGQVSELTIKSSTYGFSLQKLKWGESDFIVGLAASKQAVSEIVKNVKVAFVSVMATVVVLLVLLSFVFSRILLRPLNDLVDTIQGMDFESGPVEVNTSSDTEIGVLTESFNDLSQRVFTAQNALKNNIRQLEAANLEIRDTQARLVHAAKMASLGQLVAGIAHELNNPISFIYSNITHLRDYSKKLIQLVDEASKKTDIEKNKADIEYDYIRSDLPRLIDSCEEGARRTRDIVIGLRNFSRLEEAKVKEVDLHEGINSTLQLLESELKGKIKVTKKFGKIPLVYCYPSQLNQVFMNILSNAIQAIPDTGEIIITTALATNNKVSISIRDTGRGMTAEVKEKIFDPFFTTKSSHSGTGLGMSISYGILQKHGGDIVVQSEVGKGSEFIVTIPVKGVT